MPRRRTTLGKGSFGNPKSVDAHAWEVLQRILQRNHPLTEDAVFLCLYNRLRQRHSVILQKVRESKDVGGYRYFSFSPDIDLLEIRQNSEIIGYELKGYRRRGRGTEPPSFYEGIDQALAYLVNPISSPVSPSFAGSIFDYAYIVHPGGSGIDRLADILEGCTPLGLLVVERSGTKELVKPRKNPYLNDELKSFFISKLYTFESYTTIRVNPIQ